MMQVLSENKDIDLIPDCSIIIPTFNEAEKVKNLLLKIDKVFSRNGHSYEVVVVDDHSSDNTYYKVRELRNLYPIHFYEKRGYKGKINSLYEGFNYTYGKSIAILDSDVNSPEEIPLMLDKLSNGYDVVVSDKLYKSLSEIKFNNGDESSIDLDENDVLKVFKRNVWEEIKEKIFPQMFDLSFLEQARKANFRIGIEDNRKNTFSFKSFFKKISEPINLLLKKKFSLNVSYITDEKTSKKEGFHYKGKEYLSYSNLSLKDSAFFPVSVRQKILLTVAILTLLTLFMLDALLTITLIFSFVVLIYFSALIFNLIIIMTGYSNSKNYKKAKRDEDKKDHNFPTYTILCPLYKEWNVLPQFVNAISKLEYPQEKLQVLLLLEENDKQTLSEIANLKLPKFFEKIVVPNSTPKTKPKACNYGLKFAKGEYTVIFDAEDIPEPDQLKKVIFAFEQKSSDVICLQAKLNFYNAEQNILTRLFTAEYSLWFDLLLPGLQRFDLPIPLGGTSNHFKTSKLKELNGWDAFNVTEDCDLGVRLHKKGYKTSIVNSVTWEEANSDLLNWIKQRSRWVKGYIQTYLVHLRDQKGLFKAKLSGFSFHLVTGGMIFLLINPLMWAISISYFMFRPTLGPFIEALFPPTIFYLGVFCMVFGNYVYFFSFMVGLLHRKKYHLIKYAFFVPFYYLLMSLAAWSALYQFLTNPYYWFKTKHGFHLSKEKRNFLISDKAGYAYS